MKRLKGYSNYPIPFIKIDNYHFDKGLVNRFSYKQLNKYRFLPMDLCGNVLTICVEHPSPELLHKLQEETNKIIRFCWCHGSSIKSVIQSLKKGNGFYKIEPEEINWKG